MILRSDSDNVPEVQLSVQESANSSRVFTISGGGVYSPSAKIVVATDYESEALKTYIVGDGITLSVGNTVATWAFNPTDWGNSNAVADVALYRITDNQRDCIFKIKVNRTLL